MKDIATFDEEQSAFLLEAGDYRLLINDTPCGSIRMASETIVEKVRPVGEDTVFGIKGKAGQPLSKEHSLGVGTADRATDGGAAGNGVVDGRAAYANFCHKVFSPKVETLLTRLSDQDKIRLVTGGGYAIRCFNNVMGAAGRTCTKLLKKGIPNIVLADGPAGLNVTQSVTIMKDGTPRYPDGLPEDWRWGWLKNMERFVKAKPGKGRPVYRYMTAWPSETVLAQSWDMGLLEEVGRAVGREMLEIGVSVWLAPGLNIHRNPLCGRNFEYYSEDPLISGKMAAAITKGVQSCGGVGVTVKHFCCNNQEDNRTGVSENVSQRALREIYLRAFRIAVEEGKPWCMMSSYNRVNGVYVCNSYDFCTRVLRQEWGFDGIVMSDWNAVDQCSYAGAVNAGNDLIMPGNKAVEKALQKALKEGKLDTHALELSAGRILEMIFASAACEGF